MIEAETRVFCNDNQHLFLSLTIMAKHGQIIAGSIDIDLDMYNT